MPCDLELHGQAGRPRPARRAPASAARPGCGSNSGIVLVAGAQDVEQRAQLAQRVAAGVLDRLEAPPARAASRVASRRAAVAWMVMAPERVRDDVVQLAGDACALGRDGLLGAAAALALEALALLGQRASQRERRAASGRRATGCAIDQHRREDGVGEQVGGVRVPWRSRGATAPS